MPPTGEDHARGDSPVAAPPGFLELRSRTTAQVYRFLCSLTNDPVQADDLHQETFVRLLALKHWDKVEPLRPKQQLTWLLRTAHHVFIDQCRREGRGILEPLPDELPASVEWAARVDQRVDAKKLLCRLPMEHREVLFLRFVADLRPAEIGEVLGMPPRTVTRRLDQAKRAARRLTAAPGEEG